MSDQRGKGANIGRDVRAGIASGQHIDRILFVVLAKLKQLVFYNGSSPLDTVPGQALLYQVFLGCPDRTSVYLHIMIGSVFTHTHLGGSIGISLSSSQRTIVLWFISLLY